MREKKTKESAELDNVGYHLITNSIVVLTRSSLVVTNAQLDMPSGEIQSKTTQDSSSSPEHEASQQSPESKSHAMSLFEASQIPSPMAEMSQEDRPFLKGSRDS